MKITARMLLAMSTIFPEIALLSRIISIFIFLLVTFPVKGQTDSSNSTGVEIGGTIADDPPDFPGGYDAMFKYLDLKIKPPAGWRKDSINGKVFVQFLIKSNGDIVNPKLLKGLNPVLDSIALDAIRTMPKWVPAKLRGSPVDYEFNLPVQFGTPDKSKKKSRKNI
ncbi:MAG: energy transducer TonB [Bacteroidales bacterium]